MFDLSNLPVIETPQGERYLRCLDVQAIPRAHGNLQVLVRQAEARLPTPKGMDCPFILYRGARGPTRGISAGVLDQLATYYSTYSYKPRGRTSQVSQEERAALFRALAFALDRYRGPTVPGEIVGSSSALVPSDTAKELVPAAPTAPAKPPTLNEQLSLLRQQLDSLEATASISVDALVTAVTRRVTSAVEEIVREELAKLSQG